MFLTLLMLVTTIAPAPNPRIEWVWYEATGMTVCKRIDGRMQCAPIPAGSYIVVPTMVVWPDPEEEKKKS